VIVRSIEGDFRLQALLQFAAKTAKLISFFSTFKPKQLNVLMNLYRLKFRPIHKSRLLQIQMLEELSLELAIGETQLQIECENDIAFGVRISGISKQATPDLTLAFKFLHSSGIDVTVTVGETTHQMLSVSQIQVNRQYRLYDKNWTKSSVVADIQNGTIENFVCKSLMQIRGVSLQAGPHLGKVIEYAKSIGKDLVPILAVLMPPPAPRSDAFEIKDAGEEIKLELDLLTINIEHFGSPDLKDHPTLHKSHLDIIKRKSIIYRPKKSIIPAEGLASMPVSFATIDFRLITFKLSELTREIRPNCPDLRFRGRPTHEADRLF